MKKISDERLILQNLKNIRITYFIQTLGILAILGYELITKGFEGMRENPLWLVFMVTTIVFAYLSMSISVEYENKKTEPQMGLRISLLLLILISAVVAILVSFTDGFTIINGLIIGGIIFICGLLPIVYIYNLRKKTGWKNEE